MLGAYVDNTAQEQLSFRTKLKASVYAQYVSLTSPQTLASSCRQLRMLRTVANVRQRRTTTPVSAVRVLPTPLCLSGARDSWCSQRVIKVCAFILAVTSVVDRPDSG